MRIRLNSIFVQDQEKALRFYTEVLGFVKKTDLQAGDFRWLTVVSAEDRDGTELVLEPAAHPAAVAYQKEMLKAGIPLTAFEVGDIEAECARLAQAGVKFTTAPLDAGTAIIAIFDDTCGNLIQVYQKK